MSHVTRTNESCHTHGWVMSHARMRHATRTNESCRTRTRHVRKKNVTRMNQSCHTYEQDMSRTNASRHTCERVMAHVSNLDWQPHMSETCHTWMSHVTHVDESCRTHEWIMPAICMSHVTHMNGSCHPYERDMSHAILKKINRRTTSQISSHDSYTHTHEHGYTQISTKKN